MKYQEVEYRIDDGMPIRHLFNYIALMERRHGAKATVRAADGRLLVTPTKMPVIRCPTCKALAGVKIDGSLAAHTFKATPGYAARWERCPAVGTPAPKMAP